MKDWRLIAGICAVALGFFFLLNYSYLFLGDALSKNPDFKAYSGSQAAVSPMKDSGSRSDSTSRPDSTSSPYLRVVKIEDKAGRKAGGGWATINITVENISKQVVKEIQGRFECSGGYAGKQNATILHRGKILPGSQEIISLNIHFPRDGGLHGRKKVIFTKVEVE
jgi:hypothetical protein